MRGYREIEVYTYALPEQITSSADAERYDLLRDVGEVLDMEGSVEALIIKNIREDFPTFVDIEEADFPNLVKTEKVEDPNNDGKNTFILTITLPDNVVESKIQSREMSPLDSRQIKMEIVQFAKRESPDDKIGVNVPNLPVYTYILNRLTEKQYPKLTKKQRKYVENIIYSTLKNFKTEVRRVSWVSHDDRFNNEVISRASSDGGNDIPETDQEEVFFEDDEPNSDFTADQVTLPALQRREAVSRVDQPSQQAREERRKRHNQIRQQNRITHNSIPQNEENEDLINESQEKKEKIVSRLLIIAGIAAALGYGYVGLRLTEYVADIVQMQEYSATIWKYAISVINASVPTMVSALLYKVSEKDSVVEKSLEFVGNQIMYGVLFTAIFNGALFAPTKLFEKFIEANNLQGLDYNSQFDILKNKAVEVFKNILKILAGAGLIGGVIYLLKSGVSRRLSERKNR